MGTRAGTAAVGVSVAGARVGADVGGGDGETDVDVGASDGETPVAVGSGVEDGVGFVAVDVGEDQDDGVGVGVISAVGRELEGGICVDGVVARGVDDDVTRGVGIRRRSGPHPVERPTISVSNAMMAPA